MRFYLWASRGSQKYKAKKRPKKKLSFKTPSWFYFVDLDNVRKTNAGAIGESFLSTARNIISTIPEKQQKKTKNLDALLLLSRESFFPKILTFLVRYSTYLLSFWPFITVAPAISSRHSSSEVRASSKVLPITMIAMMTLMFHANGPLYPQCFPYSTFIIYYGTLISIFHFLTVKTHYYLRENKNKKKKKLPTTMISVLPFFSLFPFYSSAAIFRPEFLFDEKEQPRNRLLPAILFY